MELADAIIQARAEIVQGGSRNSEEGLRFMPGQLDADAENRPGVIREEHLTERLVGEQPAQDSLDTFLAHSPWIVQPVGQSSSGCKPLKGVESRQS